MLCALMARRGGQVAGALRRSTLFGTLGSRPIGRTLVFGASYPGSSPGSPVACLTLYDPAGERPHRADHGGRRGNADALVGAKDAASRLRAPDDRLARPRRA